jgi:multicomponent Na+:H+ antiporter subunit G
MTVRDAIGLTLVVAGVGFFVAGTVGLLRFPDVFSRLHALTKADNVGLGLVCAGLMTQAESARSASELLVVWVLALVAGSVSSQLIARHALRSTPSGGPSDAGARR